ncbi:tRNA uridine-5-carboxymethylaminomethyl(34) synthesis GTPase MnmE [bacterium]|nr:tRNA uridine-5-carboxymethylaminomethyl(34) synthesis GTPase MnmE [bacterium]
MSEPGEGGPAEGSDTIAALATTPGLGAVAVVRLSGPRAWEIGRSLAKNGERFDCLAARITRVLSLVDPRTGNPLDRALIVKYRAPESFTGEDVVEFQTHGGYTVPVAVLDAAKSAGARQARAGEFTRRAFLNGKLDLAAAEALDLIIQSRSTAGSRLGLAGLEGGLGREVGALRLELLELKALLEYEIDFPEEEPPADPQAELSARLERVTLSLRRLLAGAERNLILARGAMIVIAGAPNSGKSSLFNCLAGQERSIVTAAAGTTRDAVETEVQLEGVSLRLVDTAGLRHGRSKAERLGVEFSRRYLERADLVLFLHPADGAANPAEQEFLAGRPAGGVLRLLSKADLLPAGETAPEGYLPVSVKTGRGLEALKQALLERFIPGGAQSIDLSGPQVASRRQKGLLEAALAELSRIDRRHPPEVIAASLEEACTHLGELTGVIGGEEVLDAIFSRFCVGK